MLRGSHVFFLTVPSVLKVNLFLLVVAVAAAHCDDPAKYLMKSHTRWVEHVAMTLHYYSVFYDIMRSNVLHPVRTI